MSRISAAAESVPPNEPANNFISLFSVLWSATATGRSCANDVYVIGF